jgi:hypothetical protein
MGKKQGLTPEQEMAYHLWCVADAVTEGNAWAIGEARSMLAHRVLRAALEQAMNVLGSCVVPSGGVDDAGALRRAIDDAAAALVQAEGGNS